MVGTGEGGLITMHAFWIVSSNCDRYLLEHQGNPKIVRRWDVSLRIAFLLDDVGCHKITMLQR